MRNLALEAIKQCGVANLCAMDGCACLGFQVQRVHVEVFCRKSSENTHPDGGTTVRVYSRSMEDDGAHDALLEVGNEVVRQLIPLLGAEDEGWFNVVLGEPGK